MGAAEGTVSDGSLPYEILGVAEETASTTVYHARELGGSGAPRSVALERLWTGGEFARQRFLEIARVAEGLGQPPNRRFLGLGEVEGRPCIVWEPLAGMSLRELLQLRPHLIGEKRWQATVGRCLVQAGESLLALRRTALSFEPNLKINAADLWVLADGSTRVRVLECLFSEIPSSSAAAEGPPTSEAEQVSSLGSCLWELLVGAAPETSDGASMIVPPALTMLPPTLQSVLLEAVGMAPGHQTFTLAGLVGAVRAYLSADAVQVSPEELSELLEPTSPATAWDRRPPKESGVSPVARVRGEDPPSLPDDPTEIEVSIVVDDGSLLEEPTVQMVDVDDAVDVAVGERQRRHAGEHAQRDLEEVPVSFAGDAPFEWSAPVEETAQPSLPSNPKEPAVIENPEFADSALRRFEELPELPQVAPERRRRSSVRRHSRPNRRTSSSYGGHPRRRRAVVWNDLLLLALGVTIASAVGITIGAYWRGEGTGWIRSHVMRWIGTGVAPTGSEAVPLEPEQGASQSQAPERARTVPPAEQETPEIPADSVREVPQAAPAPERVGENPTSNLGEGLPAGEQDPEPVGEAGRSLSKREVAGPGGPRTRRPSAAALRRRGRGSRRAAAPADDPGVYADSDTGVVTVMTEGRWADAFVGDRFVGRTPLTFELEAGEHRLTIRPSGYEGARTVMLRVTPGGHHQVRVPLLTHPRADHPRR